MGILRFYSYTSIFFGYQDFCDFTIDFSRLSPSIMTNTFRSVIVF